MRRKPPGGLVYSTEGGRMCPGCRRPIADCACNRVPAAAAGDGVVRVSHETKGRRGKGVTLIRGLALEPSALAALGKEIKTACGSGGTVKDGTIEVQGDHCERVMALLAAQGLKVNGAPRPPPSGGSPPRRSRKLGAARRLLVRPGG